MLNWCYNLSFCGVDLQGQLTQAEQHATQYKSIADSVECSLREQTAASEQFKQTLEARVTELLQGTGHFCCLTSNHGPVLLITVSWVFEKWKFVLYIKCNLILLSVTSKKYSWNYELQLNLLDAGLFWQLHILESVLSSHFLAYHIYSFTLPYRAC